MIMFGPAGSGGLGNKAALPHIKKLGLTALEVEFTYGVRMSFKDAREIGLLAKKLGVMLSVHAPYYINLASKEKEKVFASRTRILESCERASCLGASQIVFHAGFYQEREKEEVYQIIKKEIKGLQSIIEKNNWDVVLAPEITGKATQFGSLDELLRLKEETGIELCVDFAHVLARDGEINYKEVFRKLKPLTHIHSHFSGIEYTQKGERRHIITEPKVITPLLKEALKMDVDITIINESPDPIGDSLKMQKISGSLIKKGKDR